MARMALFWGALWPALLPILCVLGLFAAVALLEILALLPAWSHVALLVLFALLLIGAVWLGDRQWRKPPAGAVTERLERDSGLIHRPLGTLQYQLANSHDGRGTALWRSHQRRARSQLRNVHLGLPRPGLPQADPWALTPDFSVGMATDGELEARINPPDYTGLPPQKLDPKSTETLRVAQGSILMARVYGGRDVPGLSVGGAVTPFLKIDGQNYELNQAIEAGQRLSVTSAVQALADWLLAVIADQPSTITADEDPKITARQALRLSYQAADDYGLAEVWAKLRRRAAAPANAPA